MRKVVYGDYTIIICDNNSVKVEKKIDGVVTECGNSKQALREISVLCGFAIQDTWNTQQLGRKVADYIEENHLQTKEGLQDEVKSEPAESVTSQSSTNENPVSAKVRVYGKAQNRTALGIMHAYMVMHPQATLEDIREAFPTKLNPDKGVDEIFIPAEEKGADGNWDGFFKGEDEILTMGDQQKVAVVKMWTKPSFERTIQWAEQYGIVVAKFEAADKGGKKGGFRLEYLNGYLPPVAKVEPEPEPAPIPEPEPAPVVEEKKSKTWLWILIALLLLGGLAYFLTQGNREVKVVEKVVTVVDTVYIQQLENIEKKYNAVQFEKGKAELKDEAKFVLYDLVKVLEQNPQLRLRLEGHTSAEGDKDVNQKLSEARAKAAVDFVISRGIDQNRLEYVGKGSSELKNSEDPMASENRRTEIEIIK